MKTDYSLVTILRNDPEFAQALARKKEAVKKDKENLVAAATTYADRYREEIEEGTKRRQLLITEGEQNGLSEEEAMRDYGKFIPTVYTPILNFLFFMFREEAQNEKQKLHQLTKQYIEEFGYENVLKAMTDDVDDTKEVNLRDVLSDNSKDPADMDTFIYGNMTHDTFKKIKKLKALSKSPNPKEAALAFTKCMQLCRKYGLDYDKIPCKVSTPV